MLDFFAGSGTTAHAVAKLNALDGGRRKYILVSSAEASHSEVDKNVCRDICARRIKSIIKGYKTKDGEFVKGLGGNFAYLRSRRIPVETVFSNIQHDQIWTALQLIHTNALVEYSKKSNIQVMFNTFKKTMMISYIPKLNNASLQELKKYLKDKEQMVVYSWQPSLLKQYLDNGLVTVEAIPQYLIDRFSSGTRR